MCLSCTGALPLFAPYLLSMNCHVWFISNHPQNGIPLIFWFPFNPKLQSNIVSEKKISNSFFNCAEQLFQFSTTCFLSSRHCLFGMMSVNMLSIREEPEEALSAVAFCHMQGKPIIKILYRTNGFIRIKFVDKLYDHNCLFISSSIVVLSALFISDIWLAEDFLWNYFSIKFSNHLQTCEFIKTYFEREWLY